MKLENLEKLYIEELKDLYSAEEQLVEALPKLAEAARTKELKEAINDHLDETKEHVRRLKKLIQDRGEEPGSKKCKGMEALIREGEEMLGETEDDAVRDAAIIASAQKAEHYEIAGYGTVRTYADTLGYEEAVETLQTTLDEEAKADELLSEIAETTVNREAAKA